MTLQEHIQQLEDRIAVLEQILFTIKRPDTWTFENPITGGTRGLQMGKTGSKVGFFGTPPVVIYATGINSTAGATYGSTEQNMINTMAGALKAYGLMHT